MSIPDRPDNQSGATPTQQPLVVAMLQPLTKHRDHAHQEESPGQWVDDLLNLNQYLPTHTVLVQASLHVVEQAKVGSLARTTIDAVPIQVFVIERHRLFTESGAGASLTTEWQATDLFAPSLGLAVYEVAKTVAPNQDGSVTTTTTVSELLHTKAT